VHGGTLTFVALGLVVAAGGVAGRWRLRRVDGLGRPLAFPVVSVVLLGVLAAGAATPDLLRARQERRLARAASALAGGPVAVHFQGFGAAFVDTGPELGYVRYRADGIPERSTLIKRDQCRDLAAYLRSGKDRPSRAQVIAVHVLTHEAMHMAGITDEGLAECAAVQRDARTAVLLGAPAGPARALAGAYWRGVYPYLPGGYRSAGCIPGGPLDEHLPDPPWGPAGA
jgi:hypothetical protein